jgi:HEAT repeat protein
VVEEVVMEEAHRRHGEPPGGVQPATAGDAVPDAPLRAAVLAGHDGDRDVALRLTGHRDPAVRAAAYGALARTGTLDGDALRRALADDDAAVRRRACLLAGRMASSPSGLGGGGDRVTDVVAALTDRAVGDTDASVVEVAAWALGEAGTKCGPAALQALVAVAHHPDALCRESAVAALGAIGDPGGLDTVLGALDDKAPVRRRAAVALAAFADRRADDALRRCLDDRDWQVRQIAEDLLGDESGNVPGEGEPGA